MEPGHIVGAITNEADITGGHIGRIRIFEQFSTIGLREGMPPEVLRILQKTRVCGRELRLSRDQGPPRQRSGGFQRKPFQKGGGSRGGFKARRFQRDRG